MSLPPPLVRKRITVIIAKMFRMFLCRRRERERESMTMC